MLKVFTELAISSSSQLNHVPPADPETVQPHQPATQQHPGGTPPRPGPATGTARPADTSATLPPQRSQQQAVRNRKHQAGRAIGRVRPLAAGTESEDHNEHDQYI
jgi:hypothetical protein